MLFQPNVVGINTLYDNFGATLTDAAMGLSTPAAAVINTKNTTVQVIAGATVVKDCYGISIIFTGGAVSAAIRRFLVDVMVDPAGGTAWTVLIPNLLVGSCSYLNGSWKYYFPLKIKAGSAVGVRVQGQTTNAALRTVIQLYGEPRNPQAQKWGSFVEAIGVVTGTTSGTAITPVNGAQGAWTLIGTTVKNLWWWQTGGIVSEDTTIATGSAMTDVSAGDATFKEFCMQYVATNNNSTEQCGKSALGLFPPNRWVKGGTNIYARCSYSVTVDTTTSTAVYGMG